MNQRSLGRQTSFLVMVTGLTACFTPNVSNETDGGSTGDESGPTTAAATDEPTTGPAETTASASSSSSAEESSTTGADLEPQPPSVVLTVNGSADPDAINRAQGVALRAEASDSDGSVASVEFTLDGEPLGPGEDAGGGEFTLEWIASGADENGSASISVTVTDNDGLEATDSVVIELDLPNGGPQEGWNFDNGQGGFVQGLHPSREGDEIVWTGFILNDDDAVTRVDRLVGDPWEDNVETSDEHGGDVVPVGDGRYAVVSAAGDGDDVESRLRIYDAAGSASGSAVFDGSPNGTPNWPVAVEIDSAGDFYMLGVYVGATAFSSYLLKSNDNFTIDWKRDLTGSALTDGEPTVADFDIKPDGSIAVIGARVSGTDKLWLGFYSPDGDLEDQSTLLSEFDTSIGYDVTWTEDGGVVIVAGVNDGEGWHTLVRSYDEQLTERWSHEGSSNEGFSTAVDADDFGRVVTASAESCTFSTDNFWFGDCQLIVRSYDAESGNLRWEHVAEGGDSEFVGPILARPGNKLGVETDRYGYAYVSAPHELPLGGGGSRPQWWAEKYHP